MKTTVFTAGSFLLGVALTVFVVRTGPIKLGMDVPIADALNLVATAFIAVVLPFALERIVNRPKRAFELLAPSLEEIARAIEAVHVIFQGAAAAPAGLDQQGRDRMIGGLRSISQNLTHIRSCIQKARISGRPGRLENLESAYFAFKVSITGRGPFVGLRPSADESNEAWDRFSSLLSELRSVQFSFLMGD